jgi:MbtH protein
VQSTTSAPTTDTYVVVRNDEDQYALWPANAPVPAGWHDVGVSGSEQECVAHVEQVWTDMRPASVRRRDRRDD